MPPLLKPIVLETRLICGLVMVSDKLALKDHGMWLVTLLSTAGELRLILSSDDADSLELGTQYRMVITDKDPL
jgi:hypothetical protein